MKKSIFVTLLVLGVLVGCSKDEFVSPYALTHISEDLYVSQLQGIKLENYIVEDEVAINIKLDGDGEVRVKLLDITGTTVSQEKLQVYNGDNILKVYVKSLPKSSYTVEVSDLNGNVIGNQILSKN